jgi:hypothetical protein
VLKFILFCKSRDNILLKLNTLSLVHKRLFTFTTGRLIIQIGGGGGGAQKPRRFKLFLNWGTKMRFQLLYTKFKNNDIGYKMCFQCNKSVTFKYSVLMNQLESRSNSLWWVICYSNERHEEQCIHSHKNLTKNGNFLKYTKL